MNSLQRAAQAGNLEQVQILLSQGVDVTSGRDLRSPLVRACEGGYLEIAKTLLEAGADPYRRDETGQSAVAHLAQMDLPWEKAEELKDLFRECALTRRQVSHPTPSIEDERPSQSRSSQLGWSFAISGWAMTLILGYSLYSQPTKSVTEDSTLGGLTNPLALTGFLTEQPDWLAEAERIDSEAELAPEFEQDVFEPELGRTEGFREPIRRPRPRPRPRPRRSAVANFPQPDYPRAKATHLQRPPEAPPRHRAEEQGFDEPDDFRPPAPYGGEDGGRVSRRGGENVGRRRGPGMPLPYPPQRNSPRGPRHSPRDDRSPLGY